MKTEVIKFLDGEPYQDDLDSMVFEKVEEFQYIEVLLCIKIDWLHWLISVRIAKAERTSFALFKFLKSKALSKKIKSRLCTTIMRSTLTYACEMWTMTSVTERRLKTYENKYGGYVDQFRTQGQMNWEGSLTRNFRKNWV